ncbi:MAG: nucleoside hydrolase [Spirochaetales bacterium]
MKHIIIDCDPGHDDAVAIFLALAHADILNILAVTTVCGNNTVENVTKNAQKVLDVAHAKTILAKGSSRPLIGEPIISSQFHGITGMDGPTDFEDPDYPVSPIHAVELMKTYLAKQKITIVALGPLTNIALLLRMHPEVIPNIEMISLMGGGIKGGNYTEYAEFNIFVDSEAAKIVFSSDIPIVMSGLDVTEKALIYPKNYSYLHAKGKIGKFFTELMDFYYKSAEQFGLSGCAIHDVCCVAYLLMPQLFYGTQAGVDVCLHGEKRGQILNINKNGNTFILTDIKQKEFEQLVLKSIEKLMD